jgi:hypothetical protein
MISFFSLKNPTMTPKIPLFIKVKPNSIKNTTSFKAKEIVAVKIRSNKNCFLKAD